jgi:hypothetical protein
LGNFVGVLEQALCPPGKAVGIFTPGKQGPRKYELQINQLADAIISSNFRRDTSWYRWRREAVGVIPHFHRAKYPIGVFQGVLLKMNGMRVFFEPFSQQNVLTLNVALSR